MVKSVHPTPQDLRPVRDWRSMIGHQSNLDRLNMMIHGNRFPPVLLFQGRDGIGKTLFSLAVSSLFFCQTSSACGHCPGCQKILDDEHPDVMLIEPESGRLKTEQAALAQEHLSLKTRWQDSNGLNRKVLILTDIDLLTTQAANRLLKTLEEPPRQSAILLTTSRKKSLLPTILSRVVLWQLSPPGIEESCTLIKNHWAQNAMTESLPADENLRALLLQNGLSPGKVIKALASGVETIQGHQSRLEQAILGNSTESFLQMSEKLSREWKWTAADMIKETELALNRIYRKSVGQHSHIHSSYVVKRRRELLSALNKMAIKRRINLNHQLTADGIFIAGRKS